MSLDDELNELLNNYDKYYDDGEDIAQLYDDAQKFFNPYLLNEYRKYFRLSFKKSRNVSKSHAIATAKLIHENNLRLIKLLEEHLGHHLLPP
jgi:hypothetical protein